MEKRAIMKKERCFRPWQTSVVVWQGDQEAWRRQGSGEGKGESSRDVILKGSWAM